MCLKASNKQPRSACKISSYKVKSGWPTVCKVFRNEWIPKSCKEVVTKTGELFGGMTSYQVIRSFFECFRVLILFFFGHHFPIAVSLNQLTLGFRETIAHGSQSPAVGRPAWSSCTSQTARGQFETSDSRRFSKRSLAYRASTYP